MLLACHTWGELLLERPLLYPLRQFQHQLHVDIGLKQGALDIPHELLDCSLVDVGRSGQLLEGAVQGLSKLI